MPASNRGYYEYHQSGSRISNNSQIIAVPRAASIVAFALFAIFILLLTFNHYLGSAALLHPVHTLRGLMELLKYKYGEAMDKLKGGERENGSGSGGAASGSGWKGFQRDVLAAAAAAKGDDTNGAEVAGGGVESSDGSVEGEYYPGLLNAAGNLCFLNSVLQSMASTPHLTTFLDSLTSRRATSPAPVSSSLLALLTALNTPSHRRTYPLRPLELAKTLASSSDQRRRLLASSEQQDAHELWGMIVGAVDDELMLLQRNERSSVEREQDSAQRRKRRREGLRNPYEHLIGQTVECLVCGYTRDIRLVPELLTTLVLPAVSSCTLEECLDEYTRMAPISEYSCRRCAMLATYDRLSAHRDRLASVLPCPTPTLESRMLIDPTSINLDSISPSYPASTSSSATTTATKAGAVSKSKKKRLNDVKKLLEQVRSAIDASDFEREIGDSVRIERVLGPAGKMINFARTPEILAFHFNRSTQFSRSGAAFKNTCQVIFPEILDLSRYSSNANLARGPATESTRSKGKMRQSQQEERYDGDRERDEDTFELYRLSSVVVHYGSHHYGHYITFRRRPSSASRLRSSKAAVDSSPNEEDDSERIEWYRASDETVEPARLDEVLRANPFLIFYERIARRSRSGAEEAGHDARCRPARASLFSSNSSWSGATLVEESIDAEVVDRPSADATKPEAEMQVEMGPVMARVVQSWSLKDLLSASTDSSASPVSPSS